MPEPPSPPVAVSGYWGAGYSRGGFEGAAES